MKLGWRIGRRTDVYFVEPRPEGLALKGRADEVLDATTLEGWLQKGNARGQFDGKVWWLWIGGRHFKLTPVVETLVAKAGADAEKKIEAPMTGTIKQIVVKTGDDVAAGALLLKMEAMKMEYALIAPKAGRVREIRCRVGDVVEAGTTLVELEDGKNPSDSKG